MVLRKVFSFSDISAVNLTAGWKWLARLINRSTFSVAIPKGENVINVTFPFSLLGSLRWINFVSISIMKILANDTAIFFSKKLAKAGVSFI